MALDANEKNRRLVGLASSPNARFWRIDYGGLSLPEKVFRSVWDIEAEVNNGGFHQYFTNTTGRLAPDAAEALRAIDATTMSGIVQEAVASVGHEICWSEDVTRTAALASMNAGAVAKLDECDEAFLAYPDDLTALLYTYVSEHRDEIHVPPEF